MTELRATLPPLPARMQDLLRDVRGYPVPAFVQWIDGAPEFRVMSPEHLLRCINEQLCWTCGKRLGAHLIFVIGPMCAVNHISAEPPSHLECAEFSVRACPWLSMPKALRREAGMPSGAQHTVGMITRNPGVSLLWATKDYRVIRAGESLLFQMGKPRWLETYAEKRLATCDEIKASFDSGLPALLEKADIKNPAQQRQFDKDVAAGRKLLGIT